METKKFEVVEVEERSCIVKRVKALHDFNTLCGTVHAGEIGGIVNGEHNLSQDGSCWIYAGAKVLGIAYVENDAVVFDSATILGRSVISGKAVVRGKTEIYDDAKISGNTELYGRTRVYGRVTVLGSCRFRDALIKGDGFIVGEILING